MRLRNFYKLLLVVPFIIVGCTNSWNPTYIKTSDSVYIKYQKIGGTTVGFTSHVGGNSKIVIDPELDEAKKVNVISHELMHSLGYIGHIQWREDCVFSSNSTYGPFCSDDIILLKRIKTILPILVEADKDIRELTICAIYNLNQAAEKELFRIK